jgi:SPP1 family predicted phage head-tail adaptor
MKCCDITPAKLSNKVLLQKLVLTDDGAGGQSRTWQDVHSVWAYIVQTSGSERFESDRLVAIANFRATIRFRNDITEINRIVFKDKAYQIRNVNNIEYKNKYLELILENGVAT